MTSSRYERQASRLLRLNRSADRADAARFQNDQVILRSDQEPEAPRDTANGTRLGVSLFGKLQLYVDGQPFALTSRRKTLPLLAYLLLHRHENISREFVAFLMWPDETEAVALTKLRSNLHELVRALPTEAPVPWLLASATNVRWNPAAEIELDIERFEIAANEPERLDEALQLYSRDLLEGIYDDWVIAKRETLRALYFAALDRGITRSSRAGDLERAIDYGELILTRDPNREDIVRRVMSLRERSGDREAALAAYDRFESHVRREFGVEPMPETLALREQIARAQIAHSSETDQRRATVRQRPHERGFDASQFGPLLGRDAELESLAGIWKAARARRGRVLFVSGEAGIGKSHLIAEFANDVVVAGGRVISGGTSPPEASPYEALLEALRSALPLVAAIRFEPLWKRTLATLVPGLDATNDAHALPALEPAAQADRIHEAVARALAALATSRPLVVVLEDLHWASAATIEAVRAIALHITNEPILIVATYRDDELTRSDHLAKTIREFTRDGLGETMPIPALRQETVAELARRADVPRERVSEIYRASAGNAFFVTQLLAADSHESAVPDGVFAAVRARFERLPQVVQHVAQIAAVAGSNFSREILYDAADIGAAAVGDALDALIDRRLVRERPGRGPFVLGFAHELARQTILSLSPSSGGRHLRIARAIETRHAEFTAEIALQLAALFEAGGEPIEAAHRYATAARRALDLGAVAEAEAVLGRGLALDIDARTRAELLVLAIEAGARGDVDAHLALIDRLDALGRETGDESMRDLALEALARGVDSGSVSARALRQIAASLRARAKKRGEPHWVARADLAEACIASASLADRDRVSHLLERALTTFRELRDDILAAQCLAKLALFATLGGDIEAARHYCRDLEAVAEQSGAYAVKVLAVRSVFNFEIEFGCESDVATRSAQWIALAKSAGDRRDESQARQNHARALMLAGRAGEALASMQSAVTIATAIGTDRASQPLIRNYAAVAVKLGAFSDGIAIVKSQLANVLSEKDEGTTRAVSLHSILGLAYAYDGVPSVAREHCFSAIEISEKFKQPQPLAAQLENLCEIERIANDHVAARRCAQKAMRLNETYRLTGTAKPVVFAALACSRLGEITEARALLSTIPDDASSVFDGTYWRERTALQLAQTAHICGDASRAERWLSIAEAEVESALEGLDERWRAHYLAAWWSREIAAARAGYWPEIVE